MAAARTGAMGAAVRGLAAAYKAPPAGKASGGAGGGPTPAGYRDPAHAEPSSTPTVTYVPYTYSNPSKFVRPGVINKGELVDVNRLLLEREAGRAGEVLGYLLNLSDEAGPDIKFIPVKVTDIVDLAAPAPPTAKAAAPPAAPIGWRTALNALLAAEKAEKAKKAKGGGHRKSKTLRKRKSKTLRKRK